MVWPFSLFPLQWSCQECIGVHLLEIILQDLMRLIRMWKKQGVESDWPSEVVARRSEPALQTGARVAAWERVAAGAGVEEASPDLQGFISGAFSSGRAWWGECAQTGTSPHTGLASHTWRNCHWQIRAPCCWNLFPLVRRPAAAAGRGLPPASLAAPAPPFPHSLPFTPPRTFLSLFSPISFSIGSSAQWSFAAPSSPQLSFQSYIGFPDLTSLCLEMTACRSLHAHTHTHACNITHPHSSYLCMYIYMCQME